MIRFIGTMLLVLSIVVAGTSQSTVAGLMRKYGNNENVLAFNLTGDLAKIFESAVEGETITSKVDDLSVTVFEKGDDVSVRDRRRMKELLADEGFESLINARGQGVDGYVKIYALDSGEHLDKLFAQVSADGRMIYATLTGTILYEDITKINPDGFSDLSSFMKD